MAKCAKCGRELGKKDVFCSHCGTPVPQAKREDPLKPNNAKRTNTGSSIDKRTVAIVLLALVAIAALAVAAFLLINQKNVNTRTIDTPTYGQSNSYEQSSEESVTERLKEAKSKESSSDSGISEMTEDLTEESTDELPDYTVTMPVVSDELTEKLDEDELHDMLEEYLAAAGELDVIIQDLARDFNDNYLEPSKELREELAAEAREWELDIESLQWYLDLLEVSEKSKYYDAWCDIRVLYDCLWNRVDVIVRAWDICLLYDDPEEHEEEILEPIVADTVAGNNRYYTKFNELYPKVKL